MKKRICIKLGSNVLTKTNGELNEDRIAGIVAQIAQVRSQGFQPILISSGAVATGRSQINLSDKIDTVSARQLWSEREFLINTLRFDLLTFIVVKLFVFT